MIVSFKAKLNKYQSKSRILVYHQMNNDKIVGTQEIDKLTHLTVFKLCEGHGDGDFVNEQISVLKAKG